MLAGLKTLNRLEQVLLKSELAARSGVEGIVLNSRGFLVEGSVPICFGAVAERCLRRILPTAA